MKGSTDYYSWRFCILGILQLSLALAKLSLLPELSCAVVLLPSMAYLSTEVLLCIKLILEHQDPSYSEGLKQLVQLTTHCLALSSLFLFAETMDYGFESYLAGFVPLFLILVVHLVCKGIENPPPALMPFFNLVSPTLSVCSINGTCSSTGFSLVSSVLSGFGTTLTDLIALLHPVTYVLMGISLVSLYSSGGSFVYKPFLLGFVSNCLIWGGQLLGSFWSVLFGNLILVTAVVWNNRNSKETPFYEV